MVVVRQVKAVNFRMLDLREPLKLGRGVVFVKGRNESGKSTLVEAILFGIYGDYRIVGNLRGNPQAGYSDVINHHARKAMVEVEFEVDGTAYRVERILERTRDGVSQSAARLVQLTGEGERLIASTVSGVNDQVTKLLRISWREMLTTNIVAQKDLERIIRMKSDDREKVINLMMGLESYNRAADKLESERRELQNEMEGLRARAEELSRTIALLDEQRRSITIWREKLASIERELPAYLESEGSLRRTVDFLEGLSAILRQKEDLQKDLDLTKKRLDELQEELEESFNERSRLEVEIKRLRAKSPELSSLAERIPQLEEKRDHLTKSIEGLRIPLWAKVGSSAFVILGFLFASLTPFSLILALIGIGLGLMGVEVKNKRSGELYRARSLVEKELADLESRFEAFRRDEEKVRGFEGDIQRISIRIEKLEKSQDEVRRQAEEMRKNLSKLSLPPVPGDIAEFIKRLDLSSYENAEKYRSIYLEKLNQVSEKRIRAETLARELRERIEDAEEKVAKLETLRKELDEIIRRLNALDFEVEVRRKSVELMQEISRGMREAFAPSVEEYMGMVISYFTGGRYRAVKLEPSTYDVEVYDAEAGSWFRRDIYSGGANDQFLLALRIAFTLSLLPSAKGIYPRFLILDEPLGSSDVERRNRIVSFLSEELTKFFDQLFIITHVEVDEPPGSRTIVLDGGRISRDYTVGNDEELG